MFKTPYQSLLEKKDKMIEEKSKLPENSYKKNQLEGKIYNINKKLGIGEIWNSKVQGTYKNPKENK